MIFNSVTYIIFLSVVVLIYWLVRSQYRYLVIFASSLLFYGFWRFDFIFLLLLSVIVDYRIALAMMRESELERKVLLYVSVLFNVSLLLIFKYLLFFQENMIGLADFFGVQLSPIVSSIILPLGISFYTFQTISYSVDVYRRHMDAERNFLVFGCYVTFFPQLIAGPILRAKEVIPQIGLQKTLSFEEGAWGVRRILYGLFLKVVLADNIATFVDAGFAVVPESLTPLDVWTLAFLFGFQIYFDFSAYSHIALGSAKLLGFSFPENFNFPYISGSPKEFWKRWHISLSSWIRDYLYLPLKGARGIGRSVGGLTDSSSRQGGTAALFLTWGIMGFWHGASWTFLLWGLYHGLMIYGYRLLSIANIPPFALLVQSSLGHLLTLSVIMLGWIPFRSETISQAWVMWSRLFQFSEYGVLGFRENVYLVASCLLLGCYVFWFIEKYLLQLRERIPVCVALLDMLTVAIAMTLVFIFLRPIKQFIYFQF